MSVERSFGVHKRIPLASDWRTERGERARARSPISSLLKERYRRHSRRGFSRPVAVKGNVIIGVPFTRPEDGRVFPVCQLIPDDP